MVLYGACPDSSLLVVLLSVVVGGMWQEELSGVQGSGSSWGL